MSLPPDLLGAIVAIGLAGVLTVAVCLFLNWADDESERRAEARRKAVEADHDRKQAELRRTVLALADALAQEQLAASKTSERKVARAYLTTGRVP